MMPSPYKSSHDWAHSSLQHLRPKLCERPVAVEVTGIRSSSDLNREYLKKAAYTKGQQLQSLLGDSATASTSDNIHVPVMPMKDPVVPRGPLPSPEEAVQIIQHQSSYIYQLETDLKYTQGELRVHHNQLNELLEENARLVSSQHTNLAMRNALNPLIHPQSEPEVSPSKRDFSKHIHDLEIMKSLHNSKTKILEQQLKAAREELAHAEMQIDDLKSQCVVSEALGDSKRKFGGLCIKCGHSEALTATSFGRSDIVAQLSLEKDELISALARIQTQYRAMQERESDAVDKVKVSIEVTEQASLDKAQALLQRERMHEELSTLKARFETLVGEHQQALIKTKELARHEVRHEIDELGKRLSVANQSESKVKIELEKIQREKQDISSELHKNRRDVDFYHSTHVESTTGRRADVVQFALERDMAVEERNKLKNRLHKVEQVKDEAILRVRRELEDVRLRLDKAERDLILSTEENVKLTRKNQEVEKQLNDMKYTCNSMDRSRNDQLTALTRKLERREEELQRIIAETEHRYGKQVDEIETMYISQSRLVTELREECQMQADTVKNVSSKYKNEAKQLRHENNHNANQIEKYRERLALLETHEVEHEKIHKKLRSKLSQLDDDNTGITRQMNEALNRAAEYKREVDILAGEVKFLRTQVCEERGSSPSKMNSSMVDDLLNALKNEMVEQDENICGSINILKEASKGDY